jgi:hypothetical protein
VLAGRTLFFAAVKALALRLLRSTTLTPCVFEGSYTNYPRAEICRFFCAVKPLFRDFRDHQCGGSKALRDLERRPQRR